MKIKINQTIKNLHYMSNLSCVHDFLGLMRQKDAKAVRTCSKLFVKMQNIPYLLTFNLKGQISLKKIRSLGTYCRLCYS